MTGDFVSYEAVLEGWTPHPDNPERWSTAEDWPNTVTVRVTERWGAPVLADGDDYADIGEERHLVEIDTNYKATRHGEHPVRLTRADAVQLAATVLAATEDTFHYARCGRLRAAEAAELLQALQTVDNAVLDLREHTLQDLLTDTGIDPTEQEGGLSP